MNNFEQEAYYLAKKLIEDITKSGLIFSNKTIKNYLFESSRNKVLNKMFQECSKNTQYSIDFTTAANYMPNNCIFILPKSPIKIITLVTGILYEFNKGSLSLNKFLKEFFLSDSISASFDKFCSSILSQYISSIQRYLDGYQEIDEEENIRIKEDNKNYKYIPELVKEQIEPIITSIKELIKFDNDIAEEDLREDFLELINGFSYSLDRFSTAVIYPLFISLKRLLPQKKEYQKHIKTINEIFEQYGII